MTTRLPSSSAPLFNLGPISDLDWETYLSRRSPVASLATESAHTEGDAHAPAASTLAAGATSPATKTSRRA